MCADIEGGARAGIGAAGNALLAHNLLSRTSGSALAYSTLTAVGQDINPMQVVSGGGTFTLNEYPFGLASASKNLRYDSTHLTPSRFQSWPRKSICYQRNIRKQYD